MKTLPITTRLLPAVLLGAAAVLAVGPFGPGRRQAVAADEPAAETSHRVAVMYFHRTNRCPTCKRISAYIEEAVNTAFTQRMKDGQVSLHMIDYQSPKNQKFTRGYQITRPTLVIGDVHDGKVTRWKPFPKVWSLVFEKDEFLKYVQDGVRVYLESEG
jgi:hypothetical protein